MVTPVMLETYKSTTLKKFNVDDQIIFLTMNWDSKIRIGRVMKVNTQFTFPGYEEYRVLASNGKEYTVRPQDIVVEGSPVKLVTLNYKFEANEKNYFKR